MTINKDVRLKVYQKYGGRCAYCGKQLKYEDMQIDHFVPIKYFGDHLVELPEDKVDFDNFENLMPACRRCNLYKRAHSIETFRQYIKDIPQKLYSNQFIYKVALDYGLIEVNSKDIQFYFEQIGEAQDESTYAR